MGADVKDMVYELVDNGELMRLGEKDLNGKAQYRLAL
jgi:hypothetical protein